MNSETFVTKLRQYRYQLQTVLARTINPDTTQETMYKIELINLLILAHTKTEKRLVELRHKF